MIFFFLDTPAVNVEGMGGHTVRRIPDSSDKVFNMPIDIGYDTASAVGIIKIGGMTQINRSVRHSIVRTSGISSGIGSEWIQLLVIH